MRTVFYSWQSDLEAAITRSFIQGALERALKKLSKLPGVRLDPTPDRDTVGIPGTPSITDTIFRKISMCDVFVADVSIVNLSSSRPTPNPNVLLELGHAVPLLGWDRIILVQNTAFGRTEDLPFDLRGRRILRFHLSARESDRAEPRVSLIEGFEAALTAAVSAGLGTASPQSSSPRWWGFWDHQAPGKTGHLFIRDTASDAFLFELTVASGAHIGDMIATARLVGSDAAVAQLSTHEPDRICELTFYRTRPGAREIVVDEDHCLYYHGAAVSFDGTYVRKPEPLFDFGVLSELDLPRLYTITGHFFREFSDTFQVIGSRECQDQLGAAEVWVGAPAGLFGIREGIIIRGQKGELWAAYANTEVVRYFTSEPEYKLRPPATIGDWLKRFDGKPLVPSGPGEAQSDDGTAT